MARTWPGLDAAAEFVHEAAIAILATTWMTQRWPAREDREIHFLADPNPPNTGGLKLQNEYFGKTDPPQCDAENLPPGNYRIVSDQKKQGYSRSRECRISTIFQ